MARAAQLIAAVPQEGSQQGILHLAAADIGEDRVDISGTQGKDGKRHKQHQHDQKQGNIREHINTDTNIKMQNTYKRPSKDEGGKFWTGSRFFGLFKPLI